MMSAEKSMYLYELKTKNKIKLKSDTMIAKQLLFDNQTFCRKFTSINVNIFLISIRKPNEFGQSDWDKIFFGWG